MRPASPAFVFVLACLCAASGLNAQIPVTDRPFNDGDDVFRFGIISDRTGGMRPGIFEDAVDKLELLQPEFVMSVGDLIEGDTEDPAVWTAQWDEFEPIVERLSMPFYFVAGNHDITNKALLNVWKERRGDPWYEFVYKDVLFLVLHTEDIVGGGIGPEQIAYARETLREHADVRWTLVFCHRPLWLSPGGTGYDAIDEALGDRNFTVFSGHYHHYLKDESDRMRRYILATSGGGSGMRGHVVGEFDHVTWVTMKAGGPEVVHLGLDGIIPDDIVTDRIYDRVTTLRNGSWLSVDPVVHNGAQFERLPVTIKLRNPTNAELTVRGDLVPREGVRFEPQKVSATVPPNGAQVVTISLLAEHPVEIHSLVEAGFAIELEGGFELKNGPHFLSARKVVPLDWRHELRPAGTPVVIDGSLVDWADDEFTDVMNPAYRQEGWDWSGPDDGRFRFAAFRQGDSVVVAVETFDDVVITHADAGTLQDRLMVNFTTATASEKRNEVAGASGPRSAVRSTGSGLAGEFVFDLPPGEDSFRLNIGWVDHDRPGNTKASVLWWRNGSIDSFGWFYVGD